MGNSKLSEAADLLKAAIENEDRELFGLDRLGVKLCIDEVYRCIDVLINDLCLANLFESDLEAADLSFYGCLIRHAALIAKYSYSKGRIELLEEQSNG